MGGFHMDKKTCTKCNLEKTLDCFGKDKFRKDGYVSHCKSCRNEYSKEYHKENAEKIHDRKNNYYRTELGQNYRKQYSKERYEKYKEDSLLKNKIWREENKEYRKQYHKEYCANNRDRKNSYDRKRRKDNPKIRIDESMSKSVYEFLKKKSFSKSKIGWEGVVGYSVDELYVHLESKFKPEMSWENYGTYWHIDHIIPKSWFEYSAIEDENFKKCWSLNNLQPLEAQENHKKGNRYAG
jgi:5-methylcytosine-specific restriction endonuclease McrA